MTQYKLLILQTTCQFSGKAWLQYDTAFPKDAAASSLADWSRMYSDLYNFHTRLPQQQQYQLPTPSSLPFRSVPPSSISADPGIMAPMPGPMVDVVTVTAVRSVEESMPVLTAPYWP